MRRLVALIPIAVLIALQVVNIVVFGADAILGPSQVALLVAAGVCVVLALCLYKTPWKTFAAALGENVGQVASAILILLLIGAVSGTWTMSGVVPMFICYGIRIISPKVFLVTACLLCALISVMTGSSWTTIATIGVALLGIGRAEGFSDAMTAGALQRFTRTRAGLVGSTVVTGTALNGIVSDQYLAIILTSNIFREPFERQGREERLLSRSVEDSATVTSPLFPWSSCGMTQATILSVPTLVYAPFCLFNILSPLMSFLVALIGWKIYKKV